MFWLGAIVSLCYVPGVTGAYIATQWPVLAILLPFGLLRKGPFTVFHLLGILFVAYAVAWMPWNPNIYGGVYGLWLVIIAALAVWFGTTMTSVRELYAGLAVGGAVSSAVAVFQHFGVDVVPITSAAPAGLCVNSVQQGVVLALIAVALASEDMWLWTLPLLPGILLAQSRSGFIVLLVGLLACLMRRLWIVTILAVIGPAYLLSPLGSSDAQRLFVWGVAWDNMTWLGWGSGVFYDVLMSQNGVTFFPEYAHNDFLQLGFEYGIGAAFPITVLAYAAWRSDVREWPVVLAFCTAACFSMPLFMPVAAFVALVAVGRILRVHGLHGYHRSHGGYGILPRVIDFRPPAGAKLIPVAPHHSAEGSVNVRR
jgi:hypothetical protein